MKLNWGQGLLIAILICVSGIVLLVVLSSREKIDLVSKEYYPKGLVYEEEIQKQKNAQALAAPVQVYHGSEGVNICFPELTQYASQVTGSIWFYYPADKNRDRQDRIKLDSAFCQYFTWESFTPGKYQLIIDWNDGSKAYLHKELVFIE